MKANTEEQRTEKPHRYEETAGVTAALHGAKQQLLRNDQSAFTTITFALVAILKLRRKNRHETKYAP